MDERAQREAQLSALAEEVRRCTLCPLAQHRTLAVPGEGPVNARVMCIGEAPGYHEDRQGRPFVGPAGQLLTRLLAMAGLSREEVYITNVVKCRPPGNRDPMPGEIAACQPYLDRQLEIIRPQVVLTLGRYSLGRFFPKETISKVHGRPRRWNHLWVVPMYHPAAALHNEGLRKYLEEDFQALPELLKRLEAEKAPAREEGETPGPQQLSLF